MGVTLIGTITGYFSSEMRILCQHGLVSAFLPFSFYIDCTKEICTPAQVPTGSSTILLSRGASAHLTAFGLYTTAFSGI